MGDNGKVLGMKPDSLCIDRCKVCFLPDALQPAEGVSIHMQQIHPCGAQLLWSFRRAWAAEIEGEDQTASLCLPFARLRLRTSCPPFEAILARKPWVLLRLVLLNGLSVFFMSTSYS